MEEKQQGQNSSTLLEYLPNELFAQIFSYLNGVDAVFAFSQLNNRFQCLLFEYCQFFDFESISKVKFDVVFQQYDRKRWKSLQISDDERTPDHVEYFCQFYSLVKDFPQLETLSMLNMKPCKKYTVLSQLSSLTNLVSLNIGFICGQRMSQFDLPNLKKLIFNSCANTNWIKNFSQVESIEYTMHDFCCRQKDLIWPSTLRYLRVTSIDDYTCIQHSLTLLSQLCCLEIYQKERGRTYPHGESWKELIRSSLPLLKNFRFYFQFNYSSYPPIQIEQIFASFSTPFYVLEKSWFVRCDIDERERPSAAIYTVPFAFDRFTIFTNSLDKSISAYLNNNNNASSDNIYANIKTLVFEKQLLYPDQSFRKTEIVNLVINSDFDSINWIHVLAKLRCLEIKSQAILSSENFLYLLDNTPHLYSLVAEESILRSLAENWNNVAVCYQLSCKIRSLKVNSMSARSYCLNKDDVQQIIRIFAFKCQHLSVCVDSPNNTIGLILQSMSQLHSLHVFIIEENYSPINMRWLKMQQTKFNESNCIIDHDRHHYYFWLGKSMRDNKTCSYLY